jgi:hypothetical protein
MSAVTIKPGQLAGALREEFTRVRRAQIIACHAAANRFQAFLAEQTDARGLTDTGLFKAGWRVARLQNGRGSVTYNDAPYAGIIEEGARPHKVSGAGIAAIARWAARKLGVAKRDALGVAMAIAKKIETQGQKPTYMVRDAMPMARKFYAAELVRLLRSRSRRAGAA